MKKLNVLIKYLDGSSVTKEIELYEFEYISKYAMRHILGRLLIDEDEDLLQYAHSIHVLNTIEEENKETMSFPVRVF